MIQSLNQQAFRDFGTILSDKDRSRHYANHHSISLSPDQTQVYQTVADTWLSPEAGAAVLSVSADGKRYLDFYLDKPLRLYGGVWFALGALEEPATVQLSAFSLPRLLTTKVRSSQYEVHPQAQVKALYSILYQEREPGFLFPGQALEATELVYVDQGSLHSLADGQDLLLEQGELVLYPPGQWHMQYADIGVAPRFVAIRFDAAGCRLSALANRKFSVSQRTAHLLQALLREQETFRPHAPDMMLTLLQLLLLTLLREAGSPQARLQSAHSVNQENDIIRRAQQYITGHVREKLSVPVVARSIDVSPSYLTALFQKHLQIAPGEYIRRIKLQQSKQLIREGNLNFTQIAEELQYSTVHHFSRQFKEKFGITPSEYARSVR